MDWANDAADRHRSRTHKALIDSDTATGRKLINQYEVLEELGRGVHGKVKKARDSETGEHVAIKIIPRFSKKRRLGKVTALSQQDKTKREIAILKKIRHPNVVALLEIIDDPELQKIYMVLEYVALGEIMWRKKGLPHICQFERIRIEREMMGDPLSPEEEKYHEILERRQALKELKRAKMSLAFSNLDFWSIEHGAGDDASADSQSRVPSQSDLAALERVGSSSAPDSLLQSQTASLGRTRSHSVHSLDTDVPPNIDPGNVLAPELIIEGNAPPGSNPVPSAQLDGTMYGPYMGEGPGFRGRSSSMADSIISHMSSLDFNPHAHDPFADDFSYVPCFTYEQARTTFRDTVLGLEYLHYQGVVHRDIKPANLLQTKDHRVKISDFGVSYFGRPNREGEPDDTVPESEAKDFDDDLELSKTVGTPAFFAPELCYTDPDKEVQPKVSEQIDVWSLGVTLYCLIYARIPFLAEDEYQMFQKIANEPVYIPRRRLRPADPNDENRAQYRDDGELVYEDVDDVLEDLLRRMLKKDPAERIRLKEIKHHPWVVEGIPDLRKWHDETDPARPSLGRKIQVDEREMSDAVVPLNFLQRARCAVRKAVGKVIHPLVERGDSRARRRATSSVASSENVAGSAPQTPQAKETSRNNSPLPGGDSAKGTPRGTGSQPTTPREQLPYDPLATVLGPLGPFNTLHDPVPRRLGSPAFSHPRMSATPPPTSRSHRHSHTKSIDPCYLTTIPDNATSTVADQDSVPPSTRIPGRRPHRESPSRAKSVDGGLVGPTVTERNGESLLTKHLKPMGGVARVGIGADASHTSLPSPLLLSSTAIHGYQHHSDPNIRRRSMMAEGAKRPPPARRALSTVESKWADVYKQDSPLSRSVPSDGIAGQPPAVEVEVEVVQSPVAIEPKAAEKRPATASTAREDPAPRDHPASSNTTSRSASMDTVDTPSTTPGDRMSPTSSAKTSSANVPSEHMLAFQSDPSLPALLSGASSISADLEGELLGRPGVVGSHPLGMEARAAGIKPVSFSAGLVGSRSGDSGIVEVPVGRRGGRDSEPESESDSEDEGLTMMSRKKTAAVVGRVPAARRGTNGSVGSADTARRAV